MGAQVVMPADELQLLLETQRNRLGCFVLKELIARLGQLKNNAE